MFFIKVVLCIVIIEILVLLGCITIDSLSYLRLEIHYGIIRYKKLHKFLISWLWYLPEYEEKKKEKNVYQGKKSTLDVVEPPMASKAQGKEVRPFMQIEINDKERTFTGFETGVLQFTKSAWEQLIEINVNLGRDNDQDLVTQMRNGVWCRYFNQNKKGEKGHYLHFLSGRFIFYTVFKEEEQSDSQNELTARKKNLFIVTSTKHSRRGLEANREVNDMMNHGVMMKCDWKVFKPTGLGERKQEFNSVFSEKILDIVLEKQNNYHLLTKNEKIRFQSLESWKEFVDLSQKVELETGKIFEQVYLNFKPIPDSVGENRYVIRFYMLNASAFKPKQMVSIYNYYENQKIHAKGTIREINSEYLDISIMDHYGRTKIPKKGIIRSQFNNRSHQIQMEAIDKITSYNTRLASLIEQPANAKPPIEEAVTFKSALIEENIAQQSTVKKAVGTEDLLLIQGPPGTGKTSVIAEIVEQFVERGKKVLISSQTNLAVDNVFEKIGKKENITSIRCGKEERILDSIIPYKLEKQAASMQKGILVHINSQKEALLTLRKNGHNYQRELLVLQICFEKLELEHKKLKGIEADKSNYVNHAKVPSSKLLKKHSKALNKLQKQLMKKQTLNAKLEDTMDFYHGLPGKKGFILYGYIHILTRLADWHKKGIDKKSMKEMQFHILIENCKNFIREEIVQDRHYQLLTNQIETSKTNLQEEKQNINLVIQQLPPELTDFFDANMSLSDVKQTIQEVLDLEETFINRVKVMEEWSEYIKINEESLYNLLLENVDVVGATCIGLETDPNLDGIMFDVAIIDEASRATVPETLVPMSRAAKTILVGDHKQLPPTIKHELVSACEQQEIGLPYKESLFEQLIAKVNPSNCSMLTHQFRMHPDISEFISNAFYSGEYKAGNGTEEKIFPSTFFNKPFSFIDTSNYKNKGEKKIPRGGYENELEADFVIESLKQIIEDYHLQKSDKKLEIGIIAPYKKQKQLILSKLNSLEQTFPNYIDVEVETLDAFQGREKDIIIFSFTRSNQSGHLGFTGELYRLNVGLSRARKLLILIGDSKTLSRARHEKINPILKHLLEYILKNGNFIKVLLKD